MTPEMMFSQSIPARTETLQRYIRDSAVHEAIGTHIDQIKAAGIEQRLVHEVALLAVHNAMTQLAAHLAGELASINSFYKMKYEESWLRPSPQTLAEILTGAPSAEVQS